MIMKVGPRRLGLGMVQYYDTPSTDQQTYLREHGIAWEVIDPPDNYRVDNGQVSQVYQQDGYLPPPPLPAPPVLRQAGPLDTAIQQANFNANARYQEQLVLWNAALNGANDRASYDRYMAMVQSGQIRTTQDISTGYQPPASTTPNSPATSVSARLANTSGGSNSSFKVGEGWAIYVTGPVGARITIVANGNSRDMGAVESNGQWSKTGVMSAAEKGSWVEKVYVGGNLVSTFTFTVADAGQQTSVPGDTFDSTLQAAEELAKHETAGLPNWVWAAVVAGVVGFVAMRKG